MVQLWHPDMTTGKTIALTRSTFVNKVMSLLFNTLCTFVIAFLLRSKHLLIPWLQSLSTVIGAQENKVCHCFHLFPIYLPWSDGTRCHDLSFLNGEFQASFFHSSLSPSSRGSLVPLHFLPLELISSEYLRLLIFLPAILIPYCDSLNLVFSMMYSACNLNKQSDHI